MSLIICPECHHQVSSRAKTCPNCGVDIAGNVKRCPACGSFVLMDAETCPNCDARFLVEREEEEPQEPVKSVNGEAPLPPVKDQPQEQKSSHTWVWYVLALLIVACVAGGYLYWEYMNQRAKETEAYMLLENCNDTLSYKDFLENFPDSEHQTDVQARLNQLRQIHKEWAEACKAMSAAALQDFINAHPDSPQRNEALALIDSLDWVTAVTNADSTSTSKSIEAYENYVTQHADGRFITEAYAAIEVQKKRAARLAAQRDTTTVAANEPTQP